MSTLELNNISFSYNDIQVFKNITIKVKKGHHVSIIGNIASGKTTLFNIFNNALPYSGSYLINEKKATNNLIKQNIVFLKNTNKYDNKKVIDLLFDKMGDDNNEEIKKIISYFNIDKYLDYKIGELSINNKFYILIINCLLDKDKYLILDDVLCYVRKSNLKKIYSYAKRNKVTIINITSDLDDTLYSEYLICLYKSKIAMEGELLSCLREEKLLKRLGYKLPFMFDLSLQLNYYDVLDDIYLDFKDMENAIWK